MKSCTFYLNVRTLTGNVDNLAYFKKKKNPLNETNQQYLIWMAKILTIELFTA